MPAWGAVVAGLLALAVVPVWAIYGALRPGDAHGEMSVDVGEFLARSQAYIEENRLEDGSVRGVPDSVIPVAVRQFGFQPNVLRLRTGQRYTLEFVATDVMHGFSLQMGVGSVNAVLTPGMMVMKELMPTEPGVYLFVCNEYCGIGHQAMSGTILVEGDRVDRARDSKPAPPGDQPKQMPGMKH